MSIKSRIPDDGVLTDESAQLRRCGGTVLGCAAGLSPAGHPSLPDVAHDPTDR